MKPAVGTLILYTVGADDTGLMDNGVQIGTLLPGIIVRVFDNGPDHESLANLSIFTDSFVPGHEVARVGSRYIGSTPGTYMIAGTLRHMVAATAPTADPDQREFMRGVESGTRYPHTS